MNSPGIRPAGQVWSGLVWSGLASVLAVTLVVGCGTARGPSDVASHQDAADSLSSPPDESTGVVDIDDYLPEAGLLRLVEESDLVLRGKIVHAEAGVSIADDPDATYTVYTVRVDEVVAGPSEESIQVSLMTELGRAPFAPEGRPTMGVGDEGVWLLNEFPDGFDHAGYILTNQNSVLLVDSAGHVSGGSASEAIAREVQVLKTVEPLMQYLRSAS